MLKQSSVLTDLYYRFAEVLTDRQLNLHVNHPGCPATPATPATPAEPGYGLGGPEQTPADQDSAGDNPLSSWYRTPGNDQ